jgi:hypothetical protein
VVAGKQTGFIWKIMGVDQNGVEKELDQAIAQFLRGDRRLFYRQCLFNMLGQAIVVIWLVVFFKSGHWYLPDR